MHIKHNLILNFLGFFLLIFVLFKLTYNIYFYDYFYTIFWFCNFAALLLSIGILFKFKPLVGAVLLASIPAQFLWFLDFILYFLLGLGFGRTSDLFNGSLFEFILSVTFHIIIIPISLYAVWILGLSRNSFKLGVILFIFILLPLTYLFTPPMHNLNCVFYPCDMTFNEFQNLFFFEGNSFLYFVFTLSFWSFISVIIYLIYRYFLRNKINFSD